MGGMIAMEFALRHAGHLDRMILTGAPGAPARATFHPVMTWNWVKANDKTGAEGSSNKSARRGPPGIPLWRRLMNFHKQVAGIQLRKL